MPTSHSTPDSSLELSLRLAASLGTPLQLACRTGSTQCVSTLLEAGVKIDHIALAFACAAPQAGAADCVQLLLDSDGARRSAQGLGDSPNLLLHGEGTPETHPADGQNANGRVKRTSPLAVACEHGRVECVRLLLRSGAPVNGSSGAATPLYIAAQNGQAECVELLLAARAAVHQGGLAKGRATPLSIACQQGHRECTRLLLAAKANAEQAVTQNRTPLYIACENGQARTPPPPPAHAAAPPADSEAAPHLARNRT